MSEEKKCNFCTMRIGKVLNEEEWENPQYVPDKEFCLYRKEGMCEHGKGR